MESPAAGERGLVRVMGEGAPRTPTAVSRIAWARVNRDQCNVPMRVCSRAKTPSHMLDFLREDGRQAGLHRFLGGGFPGAVAEPSDGRQENP